MNSPLVLIVGAGPTGMTLAIELKRLGVECRLVDKSAHQAEHSQALIIQARTLEQFQRYGIATQVVDQGKKLHGARFWSDGKEIVAFDFDRLASRYPYLLFLPQTQTEAILRRHLESLGVSIERQVELKSFSQEPGAVHATLRHADGREEHVAPRWIVGCDGAHSTVRRLAEIPFEGKGVGLSFILGDMELAGPDAPSDELVLHLHGGDVVFMGRLNDKFTRVIVALHDEQEQDNNRRLSIAEFQQSLNQIGVRVKVQSADWMTPFHVVDLQAEHYRRQNIFLAGDAAHIHSPVGGQGMNTGIQDAANLAWKLAAVANNADERLLDTYEEERAEVGRKLLQSTERGLKAASTANPFVEHVRDILMPFISSIPAVRDSITGFISEIAINYRFSSIAVDRGGDGTLRAGDRMPDLSIVKDGSYSSIYLDRHSAKPLALFNGETDSEELIRHLPQFDALWINADDLDEEARRAMGSERKVLLVRPDGYIGYRGPIESIDALEAYARQVGLCPARSMLASAT